MYEPQSKICTGYFFEIYILLYLSIYLDSRTWIRCHSSYFTIPQFNCEKLTLLLTNISTFRILLKPYHVISFYKYNHFMQKLCQLNLSDLTPVNNTTI